MVELVFEAFLKLVMGFVDDRIGTDGAVRVMILMVLTGGAALVSYHWKRIIFFLPYIRRFSLNGERFVGQFMQSIYSSDIGLRYTVLRIKYGGLKSGYIVDGSSYLPDGTFFARFSSNYTISPEANVLEFVWSGRENNAPVTLGGYTRLELNSFHQPGEKTGQGFSIDFHEPPRTNRIHIMRWKFKGSDSANVKAFHEQYGSLVWPEIGDGS